MSVRIDDFSNEIDRALSDYSSFVTSEVKKQAKTSMQKLVRETKNTAPVGKRQKHYKDSITSKKTNEGIYDVEYTWYVKAPNHRLSHLLENGHVTKKGGRTKAYHFIKKASEPIIDEYEKKVEEACKNG